MSKALKNLIKYSVQIFFPKSNLMEFLSKKRPSLGENLEYFKDGQILAFWPPLAGLQKFQRPTKVQNMLNCGTVRKQIHWKNLIHNVRMQLFI